MIAIQTKEDKINLLILAFYTPLVLFFCSKMSPLYPINEWSDVNLYFNIAKAMSHGQTLYTETFDHKGPLIFFIYQLGYVICGTSFLGIYVIQSLTWIVAVYFAYAIGKLYLGSMQAFAVAALYPVFLLTHSWLGGSAEEFIAIAMTVSLYFFVRYFKDSESKVHKAGYMLMHGAMFGIAVFIKINLAIFWFFPVLAIFIQLLVAKQYKNIVSNVFAFIGGVLLVALPICLYLYYNNALAEAWKIYIELNRKYARLGTSATIATNIAVRFYQRLRFEPFQFIFILLGSVYFPIRYLKSKLGAISIILSFASLFVAVFLADSYVFYYSVPYYIYSILGMVVVARLLRRVSIPVSKWLVYSFIILLGIGGGINLKGFFGTSLDVMLRKEEPKDMIYQFAGVMRQSKNTTLLNTTQDDCNALFTLLNISPNVKYFVSPNLPYHIYPQMRDEQTKYIENKEVEYVLLKEKGFSYDYFSNLQALKENYTLVSTSAADPNDMYYGATYLYKRKD